MNEDEFYRIRDSKAGTLFRSIVKGSNFMTPSIIDYKIVSKFVVEVSHGKFVDTTFFGVTVADMETKTHRKDLSKSCENLSDVESYLTELEAV